MKTLTVLHLTLLSLCACVLTAGTHATTSKEPGILFVLSASSHGYWLPEVLTPYQILTDAGFRVVFASPDGKTGTPAGAEMMSKQEVKTLATIKHVLDRPLNLGTIDPGDYAALYVPGGAGPMFDLYDHPDVNRITATMYEDGKPVSAACHGPAAFAAVRLSNGELLVEGKNLTAKSNAEENQWARDNYSFLLEDKFRQVRSNFSAAAPYEPWVVQDGNLLTGQNPASAGPLAQLLIKVIHSNDRSRSQNRSN